MSNFFNRIKKYLTNPSVVIPILALLFSLCYFAVKSEDFLTLKSAEIPNNSFLSEILAGQKYVQEIRPEENGLTRISLFTATFGRKNLVTVDIALSDSEGNVLKKWKLDAKLLKDNYYTLALDSRIRRSKGQAYYLTITSDATEGHGITVYTNTEGRGLTLNGRDAERTLCYQLTYRRSYARILKHVNGFHVLTVIGLGCLLFWLIPRLSKCRIERAFLVVWLFFGVMYLMSATLFRIPDEIGHLWRAYEVSSLHAISEVNPQTGDGGRELPLDVGLGLLQKNWRSFSENKRMQESENLVFLPFSNLSIYSPVSYVPQGLGIGIARHLTSNVAVIAYSGRLMNWLFITLILCAAIRIIPVGKEILALVALMPMNIQESVSLAPDGLVVSVSMLLAAYVLYLRHTVTSLMSLRQYVIMYFLAFTISQLKIVYLPFILLYFLIPEARFGSRKKKFCHLAGVALLAVVSNLVWLKLCHKFLTIGGTDAGAQLSYLLTHPFSYLTVLARTYFKWGESWLHGIVGSALAELNVPTIGFMVFAYLCLLVHKFIANMKKPDRTGIMESGTFAFVILSIVLLISTSLYLQWTATYNMSIDGIQGRYFIPLMLPLFFALNGSSALAAKNEGERLSVGTASFVACVNLCGCIALLFFCIV